jgi:hypothetical protein
MEPVDIATERPDWFDLPPDEWPESARAFYQLVLEGVTLRRAATPARSAPGGQGRAEP